MFRSIQLPLSIQLKNDCVILEGFTEDAPTAKLSGHVVLDLEEATPLTAVAIIFKGVSNIPMCDTTFEDTSHLICKQRLSLFTSEDEHPQYLCPGRHTFPFTFSLGGSLPATTAASTSRHPSVYYELRATATCPDTHSSYGNMHIRLRVPIIRSLPSYSLNFQQSAEIQSPEEGNVYFALALPHSAWVVGETLACRFRASSFDKTIVVRSVDISVIETRRVSSVNASGWEDRSRVMSHRHYSFVKCTTSAISSYWPFSRTRNQDHASDDSPTSPTAERSVVLDVPIPASSQPSHSITPVVVSHHVNCTLTVVGPHGPASEMYCTLPIKLLDARLREHAQAATRRSRAVFFGYRDDAAEDDLPSYASHVRDCVMTSPTRSRRVSSDIPSYQEATCVPIFGIPPLESLKELPGYSVAI